MAKKNIATFLGPNQGLSIAGRLAYAYSGEANVTDVEYTLLDFVTPSNLIIKGNLQWYSPEGTTQNFQLTVKFNGSVVVNSETFQLTPSTTTGYAPIKLIIPPLTKVEVTSQNESASDPRSMNVTFTGKIHNA